MEDESFLVSLLEDRLAFIHLHNNNLKYHFIDLPIGMKETVENSGLDFTKNCMLDGEMDNVIEELNVSYIVIYCDTYFFIRFFPIGDIKTI